MLLLHKWLSDFVDGPDDPRQLADLLTSLGHEVESVRKFSVPGGLLTARIEDVKPHPDADRLRICTVDCGSKSLELVCGAPNVRPGQNVMVALDGAELPGGLKVTSRKVRGVISPGMILSEAEMGLSDDHSGIMELDADIDSGLDPASIDGFNDTVLEVAITPNRPDCLSVRGLAREVAASMGSSLEPVQIDLEEKGALTSDDASVSVRVPDLCPRYTARIVRDLDSGLSPLWMRLRLLACGFHGINTVVDITNYVLMELGHPLHAFDLARLESNRIVVRMGRNGEKLSLLNGQVIDLNEEMLVIADENSPVALAGIMGGMDSQVGKSTEQVLIESAWFDPSLVRRISRSTGISSESSFRFERGADIDGLKMALDRAATLCGQLAGGTVAGGIVEVYENRKDPVVVNLKDDAVTRLTGMSVSPAKSREILGNLGFKVDGRDVMVPSWRVDVSRSADLVEEVARLEGYDHIPDTPGPGLFPSADPGRYGFSMKLRRAACAAGLQEVINYSFDSVKTYDDLGYGIAKDAFVRIENPLEAGANILRRSLLPGLLRTWQWNRNRQMPDAAIFELGRVFFRDSHGVRGEEEYLAAILCGSGDMAAWNRKAREPDFYDMSGILENLCLHAGLPIPVLEPANDQDERFQPGMAAAIRTGESGSTGVIGVLRDGSPLLKDASGPVLAMELSVEALRTMNDGVSVYKPFSRFPSITIDIAAVVGSEITARDLVNVVKKAGGDIVEHADVFDVYTGKQLAGGTRSVAIRMVLRAMDRSLKQKEADKVRVMAVRFLEKKFQAVIRG